MMTEQYLAIALLAIAAAFLTRRLVIASHAWRYHGLMLVTGPETHKPAAVKVGIFRAVVREFVNRGPIEVCSCKRWLERRDREQDCVREIEKFPKDHRVWNIATKWFAGKNCAYCHKPIEPVSHIDHASALLRIADRRTVEWRDLPPEDLPGAFSECVPVCWSCHRQAQGSDITIRTRPGVRASSHVEAHA